MLTSYGSDLELPFQKIVRLDQQVQSATVFIAKARQPRKEAPSILVLHSHHPSPLTMLVVTAVLFVLGVLPVYVAGQLVIQARCSAGHEWTYNKAHQSPCLVAGALSAVCAPSGQFTVPSVPTGSHYIGPTVAQANGCRCSSVVYSLISACGYCQDRTYLNWSDYAYNCSVAYPGVYNYPIPSGIAVPPWAYLDVVTSGFNVTQAQLATGTESTGSGPAPTIAST